jgi:serine/threonine protein kinase
MWEPSKYVPTWDDCEDLEMYIEGGLHPVLIGDVFSNNRYKVVHKLGSGGNATIWLARDKQEERYIALKILTSDGSTRTRELQIHQFLAQQHLDFESAHVAPLLDHFSITGPNGTHSCLVFEVLGPSIASLRGYNSETKIEPGIARKLARQVAEGVARLHATKVALADLSASNILFRIQDINEWSVEDVYNAFGQPQSEMVRLHKPLNFARLDDSPRNLPPVDGRAPELVYRPIDLLQSNLALIKPEILMIDLGEAFLIDNPPKCSDVGTNFNYGAPEMEFDDFPSPQADIWGLACCFFEMRSAKILFRDDSAGMAGLFIQLSQLLGIVPNEWWDALGFGEESGNEEPANGEAEVGGADTSANPSQEGAHNSDPGDEPLHAAVSEGQQGSQLQPRRDLRHRIRSIGNLNQWHRMTPSQRRAKIRELWPQENDDATLERKIGIQTCPPARLLNEEAEDLEDLLSKMLRYDPTERISISEVLRHPWFSKRYHARRSRSKVASPRPRKSKMWLERYEPARFYDGWCDD